MTSIAIKPVEVEQAFRKCVGQWTGCDWSTRFGKTGLNLNGVRASHALLMARATTGAEKGDWHAAVQWLTSIEFCANEAEFEAREGVRHFRAGRIDDALEHARLACNIEEEYHRSPVWTVFKQAVEAFMNNGLSHADAKVHAGVRHVGI